MIAYSVLESRALSDYGKRASVSSGLETIDEVSLLSGEQERGSASRPAKRTAVLCGSDAPLRLPRTSKDRARAVDARRSTSELNCERRPHLDGKDVARRAPRAPGRYPHQTKAVGCEIVDPDTIDEREAASDSDGQKVIFVLLVQMGAHDQPQGLVVEPSLFTSPDARRAVMKGATLVVDLTSPLRPSALRHEILADLLRATPAAVENRQIQRPTEPPVGLPKLTRREREVMQMVLEGHQNKNIAADLRISTRTVENHRAKVMKKTGSKSLPALVRLAIAAGAMPAAPAAAPL